MLLFPNIKTPLGSGEEAAVHQALGLLRLPKEDILESYVSKSSLDARRRAAIHLVSTVAVRLNVDEEKIAGKLSSRGIQVTYKPDEVFAPKKGTKHLSTPIVIAGFGPAGIFAASLLAEEGYRVCVLERGGDMDERVGKVNAFWQTGVLDTCCNVQFGEGGAGTFSDGKLTTRINDPLCGYVLERFGAHGAPKETLRRAKPHIGTDKLRGVVRSMREEIIRNGGEVRFHAALTGLRIENGALKAVEVNGEEMACERLILAIGHSARDTFEMLKKAGVPMEPKPFSVGVRIEHRQELIDRGLYGELSGRDDLPPGEYQLSHRENGRAVYTFCMCPGGLVVPAASEEGEVVTNGMSEYKRDRENANAAVAVSVSSSDFGSDPLDGIRFQRELEARAFLAGGKSYRAPAADVGHFLDGKKGLSIGRVTPSYALGVEPVDFDQILPPFVTGMLRTGLRVFDRKLHGFGSADAILTGVETRTSSPVRIPRGEDYQSSVRGLYPCGEGAGYAGGIMSAAVDGLKVAAAIIEEYAP